MKQRIWIGDCIHISDKKDGQKELIGILYRPKDELKWGLVGYKDGVRLVQGKEEKCVISKDFGEIFDCRDEGYKALGEWRN